MKEEKLLDAIGMVGDDLVTSAKACNKKLKKKKKMKKIIFSSVAAVLVIALIAGVIYWRQNLAIGLYANKIYAAEYPELPSGEAQEVEHSKLWIEYEDMSIDKSKFIEKTVSEFFTETNSENVVYSPISAYMALGMLAEVTGGDSRQQILNLLGNDNIEELRQEASMIWNMHYVDTENTKSLLASSVWINEGTDYKKQALKSLSETYYASSFTVDMNSGKFEKAMKSWINDETGNMLEDQVNELNVDDNAFLVLLNTMFYQAKWYDEFSDEKTESGVFNGVNGDEECEYMYQSKVMSYFEGDKFTAVEQWFKDEGGSMYYILPDEGVSLDELFESKEAVEFMANPEKWENVNDAKVNLTVPKFDVEYQMNMIPGLRNLGITDVFSGGTADFSALLDGEKAGERVDSILQGARVTIDEEGCVAAAYTKIEIVKLEASMAEKEVDFVLDRPFIFVITSDVGMPLFVGVVNYIN